MTSGLCSSMSRPTSVGPLTASVVYLSPERVLRTYLLVSGSSTIARIRARSSSESGLGCDRVGLCSALLSWATTGIVNMKPPRSPTSPSSTVRRPPWASTIPLQIAIPRSPSVRVPRIGWTFPAFFPGSVAERVAAAPAVSSPTVKATCESPGNTLILAVEVSDEYMDTLAIRLLRTCRIRRLSAITLGRAGGSSNSTLLFGAPTWLCASLTWSSRSATSIGSGLIDSVRPRYS